MRKPDFCICENKAADQLCGNFEPLAIFCDFPVRFVTDLVGNPEDRFSDVAAHFELAWVRKKAT